jgi:hypothetical protein
MPHELISLTSYPTLPAAFSSRARDAAPRGCILANEEYYLVFEHRPFTVQQMTELALKKPVTQIPLEYLYVASLFYRKSRNPHYRSARPIFAFCLEYTEFTCAMKPQGFWGKLSGSDKEPAEVFSAVFSARLRLNKGKVPNDFTDKTALEFLFGQMCEHLALSADEIKGFRLVGPVSLGPDCPEIA